MAGHGDTPRPGAAPLFQVLPGACQRLLQERRVPRRRQKEEEITVFWPYLVEDEGRAVGALTLQRCGGEMRKDE